MSQTAKHECRMSNVQCRSTNPFDLRQPSFDISGLAWPRKVDLFGVRVSVTDYEQATNAIIAAARRKQPAVVSCHAVHALVTTAGHASLRGKVNRFAMVTPDGQPVRWALNLLHAAGLHDRVYGPELMLRLCRRAAEEDVGVYLFGGTHQSLGMLCSNLLRQFPRLRIAGKESPPFRPLSADESRAVVQRIRASGASLVFIGLGCPKQDIFAAEHCESIDAVQVCVGAAFDFHAGMKAVAPRWMQRSGMEWLFRLACEPRRLARRYLVTNTVFLALLCKALIVRVFRSPPGARRRP
jgi:N-acetylglucosaminyldiphosphoundecaprenol N-acetyl-beta-D-mannosaminyltransferase